MQNEMKLVEQQQRKHELPVREAPPKESVGEELVARRRMIRIETDDFMKSLLAGDVVDFAIRIGRVAFVTSGTLVQFGLKPDFPTYVAAVAAEMERIKKDFDRALQLTDWPEVLICACRMHQLWIGCAANLGMPYGSIIHYLHECYMEGKEVDRHHVVLMLRQAGLAVEDAPENSPPRAANEPEEPKP